VDLVRALGADVIVSRVDDAVDRIRAEMPAGVDAVVDAATLNDVSHRLSVTAEESSRCAGMSVPATAT